MRAAIVSIAAGPAQVPLIEAAKRLGYAVVAVDRDPDAPGMELADQAVVCSAHDPMGVLRRLAQHQRFRIKAVATKSSGKPVATTAKVAYALGLKGLNPYIADLGVTKPGLMRLAARADVPTPRNHSGQSPVEIDLARIGFPLVVKPALTVVGQLAVERVTRVEDFKDAFLNAQAASGDGFVEVEEYVEGQDVVLAGHFEDDRFWPLALLDEGTRFGPGARPRGRGFSLPSFQHAGTEVEARLTRYAERLGAELQIGTTVAFLSFRVRPDGDACLIEAHFDLAGDFIADRLFGAAGDYDLIGETLRLLAEEPLEHERPTFRRSTVMFLFAEDLAEGRADKLERLRALAGVLEVNTDIAPSGQGPVTRVGYVLARPEGRGELAERVDRVLGREPRR